MLALDAAARLLHAFPDAAIFITAKGDLVAANPAARAALHLDSDRSAYTTLDQLIDSGDKLTETLKIWSRTTTPTPGSFSVTLGSETTTFNAKGSLIFPRTDQSPPVLLVRFWPRSEANPFVLLNRKITQLNAEIAHRQRVEQALRESEAALRDRALEAEALNRTKDEFLATVSHELRTPLNAIVGWASLLRTRTMAPEVGKGLDVIYRNAQSQGRLIDDILDVSRIITGKLLLEPKRSDLVAIAEEAIEVVRPSAAAKRIEIVLERPEEACLLIADPDRLRQVIWNLLSNAVKFTDRGGSIHVEVHCRSSQYSLTVRDTGKGIDATFLPFVFDRFKQADSSTTRRVGGLGLGLALVRHIVELHGGSVRAFSEGPGLGATFTVMLPVRAVLPPEEPEEPRSPAAERAPGTPARLDGLRVLVVDDEADARELLAAVLTQAGATVEAAASVAEAFEAVARFRPHVLVSDIGMPDEDGYSFIHRLRRLDPREGGAIPSVALTAYTRAEDRSMALAAGFTTHVGKPVAPDDLISAVANLALFAPK